ncbi:ArsR/SmtB family transcription factor [Streptomyces sp. GS7]|uniref:ArsR/SmtB family transcription factor n=1 Tax=Streptomyces sp. GS7 TaxID=2692234 RepID=UPI001317B4D0|nr:metalloregulator ArsR/SmtB family transcription factor [Streptomyces sp. GS7]QHC24816.1 metalloregulator ArsR/SmtB family transcription factor [Streptomyces sp. GS7]
MGVPEGDRAADLPEQAFHSAALRFGLLASPLRLRIVWMLIRNESDVTQLALRVGARPQAVSQHLARLKLAGAVRARSEGRRQIYAVTDPRVKAVAETMMAMTAADEAAAQNSADLAH